MARTFWIAGYQGIAEVTLHERVNKSVIKIIQNLLVNQVLIKSNQPSPSISCNFLLIWNNFCINTS